MPVAARAAAPSLPTMATSTTLIRTRLKFDKITGNASVNNSLETGLSCGNMNFSTIKKYLVILNPRSQCQLAEEILLF